jgi:hypothetical protein
MAQDTTINSFEGGLNKDVALVSLPSNQYDEANDVEFISDEIGKLTTLEAKKGTGLAKTTVPNATPQLQIWRVKTYSDATQIALPDYASTQTFFLDQLDGLAPISVTIGAGDNAYFVSTLNAAFASAGVSATVASITLSELYTTITFNGLYSYKELRQRVTFATSGTIINVIPTLIQEKITTETQLEPIAYVNSQNLGFVLSVSEDNTITEIGVADEDNNWAYTRLLRTKNFIVSKNHPIEMLVEQQNDGVYTLYFTDNTIKDKCIYIPPALTQDCCLTYTPTNIQIPSKGIYDLNKTDNQTNSQLINNIGYVSYKNTLSSGGGLLTGGKRYTCRFGINGSNITTQWSILSNIVPVIAASADSGLAWVTVQGTPSGEMTSKRNILTINNAQSDVFNFVELGVVNYAGENATSAELIGRYDIPSNTFDITHTGLEQTTLLDVISLIEAEPVLLKVKDIEVKKNRLNRANVVVANEDAKWQTIAEGATVGTQRFQDIGNTGALPYFSNVDFFSANKGGSNLFNSTTDWTTQNIFTSSSNVTVGNSFYDPSTGYYTVQAADGNNAEAILSGSFNIDIGNGINIYKDIATTAGVVVAVTAGNIVTGGLASIPLAAAGAAVIADQGFNVNSFFSLSVMVFKKEAGAAAEELVIEKLIGSRGNIDDQSSNYLAYFNETVQLSYNAGDKIRFMFVFYQGTGTAKLSTMGNNFTIAMHQTANSGALQFKGTTVGEYQIPYNVANRAGYMLYEYYLTYVRFHLKNGYITAPYPLGKKYIDAATYIRGLVQITPSNELTPFTDLDVSSARKVYNYAPRVSGLNLTSVLGELAGVSFERSEPLNTVIGSGIYHNARKIKGDIYTSGTGYAPSTPYPAIDIPSLTSDRRLFGLFISNDLDNNPIKYSTGDYLKLIGIPSVLSYNPNWQSGLKQTGVVTEFLGAVQAGNNERVMYDPITPTVTHRDIAISDSRSVSFNSVGDYLSNTGADRYYKPSTSVLNTACQNSSAVAITTSDYVRTKNTTAVDDSNTYVAFYIRPIDLSSIDYRNYKPVPTGEIIALTNASNPIITRTIYGGDTYTQKVVRKESFWFPSPYDYTKNVNTVITFYAQNRLNSQLFYTNNNAPSSTWNLQGSRSIYQYLFPFKSAAEIVDEQHNFDKSYIGANQVNRIAPYNARLPYPTANPTRIYYSEEKAVGSLYDNYRKIKPLDFVDLELKNGAISAIYDIRDVMVVIQPTFVGAIPYAADTLIQSDSTAKILVGSGTVYSNRVYPLSSFGTSLKTMSCKGYNSNGNPQVYWMSDDFANFNRYDYSGVKILSSDNNMRTWFLNNTVNIKNEFDVNIYYNTKKEDLVMTSRAVKAFPTWNPATTYTPFTYVSYGAAGRWKNFEQIPSIYVSNTTNTNSNPYDYPSDWAFVDPASSTFYNMWSLIFNEKRNNFTTFMSPLQKRYFKHNNLVLTPRGVDVKGNIYQMDNVNGNYLQWFPLAGNTDFKLGNFILSTVFNKFGTDRKMINVNFERGDDVAVQPTTVTAITPTQSVDLPINETRLGVTYYPSYYDSNGDTPYGQFIKILIKKASYLKIRTIAMKFKNKFPLRMK